MNTTRIILAILMLTLVGCARFSVTQMDSSPNERTITTKISGTAWFASAQSLSRLKALQTDKSQSFGTDSINQTATNGVEALTAIARILEAIRPTP